MNSSEVCVMGDIDASVVYGTRTEIVEPTKPQTEFHQAITINQFVEDLKLRFKSDFTTAVQLSIYFFPDKSTYLRKVENDYGTRYYQIIRPEMITFTSVDAKTKKPINTVRTKNLDVYAEYGIKFETHIIQRVWDDTTKSYKRSIIRDADGKPIFKPTREIRTDRSVNYLLINTKQQTYVKAAGKFDLFDHTYKYYDWKIVAPINTRNDVQYMMKNIYPHTSQFVTSESLADAMNAGEEDIILTLDP